MQIIYLKSLWKRCDRGESREMWQMQSASNFFVIYRFLLSCP
jgi:hypothetical protein